MNEDQCVTRTKIESVVPIPNADRIESLKLSNGFQVSWNKNVYKEGEEVLYIREQAVLPPKLITELGLDGMLSGNAKNRVKARRFKQVYSEGLLMKAESTKTLPEEELDKFFEITKYVPAPPRGTGAKNLCGDVFYLGAVADFEVHKFKDRIPPSVTKIDRVSEKIHGTNVRIGKVEVKPLKRWFHKITKFLGIRIKGRLLGPNCDMYVCSKGQGNKGLVFHDYVDNAYTRIFKKYQESFKYFKPGDYLVGEIAGPNIQKGFDYGLAEDDLFIIDYKGSLRGYGDVCNLTFTPEITVDCTIEDFFKLDIETLDTKVSENSHMAEGIVGQTGKFMIKRVAERYKLRSDGTEFN
jgi:RNA ligase (TIGR02306 family)